MPRERNNIYAIAADAVDLTLDTAGTIGSMVAGIASRVGFANPPEKTEAEEKAENKQEIDNAANRVATSLRQESEALRASLPEKPRAHRAKAATKHRTAKPAHKRVAKSRAAKPKRRTTAKSRTTTTAKSRSARKTAR